MNPFSPVRLSLWKTLPLLLAFLSLMSCPSPGYTGGNENEILPESISIVGNNALPKNGTTYLTAIVEPVTAANRTVSWSSSDENAVSVNQHGKVTVSDSAQVGSEVTITVSSAAGDIKEPFLIHITSDYVAAAGINLFPPRLYLPQGGKGTFSAQILPENASDQSISWSVNHEEIELTTQGLELHVAVPNNLASGEYTVTAGQEHLWASAVIEVLPVNEEDYTAVTAVAIHLNDLGSDAVTSLEVENGGTYQFQAGITPPDATIQEVSWSSSHPSFVTVNPSGFAAVAEDAPADTEIILTIRSLAGGKSSQVILKTPSLRIYHVKPNSSGTGDGSSWDNAMDSLQTAMNNSEGKNAEIWVAAGTYVPAGSPHGANMVEVDNTPPPDPPLPAETLYYFSLRSGVKIYGGFAGTETDRSQRDIDANITIFSGDRGNNDVHDSTALEPLSKVEDNVHHVFFNPYYFKGEVVGRVIKDVVIDGVVIQGGAARTKAGEDTSTLDFLGGFNNYSVYTQGGGLHLSGLRISKVKLTSEEYLTNRKALEEKRASLTLRNVIFRRNRGGNNRGEETETTGVALFLQNVDAVLENVDFEENYVLGKSVADSTSLSVGGGVFAAYHSKISYTTGRFEGNMASHNSPVNKSISTASMVLDGAETQAELDGLVFRNNRTSSGSDYHNYDLTLGGFSTFAVIKNSIFHGFVGGVKENYAIGIGHGINGKVFLVNNVFYDADGFFHVLSPSHSNIGLFLINSVLTDQKVQTSLMNNEELKIINSILDMTGTALKTPLSGIQPYSPGKSLLRVGHSILNVQDSEIKFPHPEFLEPPDGPGAPYFSQLWFEVPAFSDKSSPPGSDGIFGSADDGFRLTAGHDRKGLFVRVNDVGDVFYSADKIRWYDEPGLTNQVSPSGEILNERDFNGDLWDGQPGIGYLKPQSSD